MGGGGRGGGGLSGPVWVGQGGCELRIEVFGKIIIYLFIFFLGGGRVSGWFCFVFVFFLGGRVGVGGGQGG